MSDFYRVKKGVAWQQVFSYDLDDNNYQYHNATEAVLQASEERT